MSAGDRGSLTSMVRHRRPGGLDEHSLVVVTPGQGSGPNPTARSSTCVQDPTAGPRRAAHLPSVAVGRCPVVAMCTHRRGRGGAGCAGEAGGGRSSRRALDRGLVSREEGAGPQKRLSARGRSKRLNLEPGVTAARPERCYPPLAGRSDEFARCERDEDSRVSSPHGRGRPGSGLGHAGASLSRGCRRARGGRRRPGRRRVR